MALKSSRAGVRPDQVDVYGRPIAPAFYEALAQDLPEWTDLPSWVNGTEHVLPDNDDEPESNAFVGDIQYPSGLEEDARFFYRKSPTEKDGLAKIRDIRGWTVVWNQLAVLYGSTETINGITFTKGDTGYTISGTNTGTISQKKVVNRMPMTLNHKYLIMGCPKNGSQQTYRLSLWFNNDVTGTSKNDYGNGLIINYDTSYTNNNLSLYIDVYPNVTVNSLLFVPQCFDLTAMMGSTFADQIYAMEQAQAGSGVAFWRQYWWLPYYKYDTGRLLSFTGTGLKTVGFNHFDKNDVVLNKYINDGDGSEGTLDGAVSSGWIPVISNTTYYISTEQTALTWGAWYDENKVFISGVTNYGASQPTQSKIKTAPSNAHYIRLTVKSALTGNIDTFCLNISDTDKNGTYEPYVSHETSLPTDTFFPTGMKSAGTAYDELTPTRAITRIGAVDLGTLTYTKITHATLGVYFYADVISLGIKYVGTAVAGNILTPPYTTTSRSSDKFLDKCICIDGIAVTSTITQIQIKDSAYSTAEALQTALDGVYLFYELAEEVVQATMSFE